MQTAMKITHVRNGKQANGYATDSNPVHLTLPLVSYEILLRFAKQHNVSLSRMAHDIIVWWYHYQKGDYK